MEIKRKTLNRVGIVLVTTLLLGGVGVYSCSEKAKEERYRQGLLDSYNRAVEREYKALVREYESLVEVIKDYSYSYNLRFKYVMKLNDLLGVMQYENDGWEYSTVENCIQKLEANKDADMKKLKFEAELRVLDNY